MISRRFHVSIDQGRMFKVAICDLKRRTRTTFEYAGSETDGLAVDYKVKYAGQL